MKRQLRRVSLPARLVREVRGILCTRPAKMKWPGGVVSFTFDDFPRSAWINGGAILEKYDVRGTYYTAMGLAGTANHLGPMFEVEDLRAARAHGHEIACHTFTHRDCCRASPGAIIGEIEENAAALSALLDGTVLTNFAYPFGGVSLSSKHALANRFASCRAPAAASTGARSTSPICLAPASITGTSTALDCANRSMPRGKPAAGLFFLRMTCRRRRRSSAARRRNFSRSSPTRSRTCR